MNAEVGSTQSLKIKFRLHFLFSALSAPLCSSPLGTEIHRQEKKTGERKFIVIS